MREKSIRKKKKNEKKMQVLGKGGNCSFYIRK